MAAEGPGPTAPSRPRPAPERRAPAQTFALVVGLTLVLAGLVGFLVDGDFETGDGVDGDLLLGLEVNGWHNVVHLASGLLLLAGLGSNSRARAVCRLFGLTYLVVTIAGIVDGDTVFGFIPVNLGDNILHALLAVLALWAAAASKDERDPIARDRVVLAEDEAPHVVGPGSGHVGGPRTPGPRVDARLPEKRHP